MLLFSVFLIGLVCILLVIVVLAQNSKGGGLVAGMGGATQLMGTRRATDWIEKATWVLGTVLVVLCLGVNAYVMSGTDQSNNGIEVDTEQVQPAAPPTTDDGAGSGDSDNGSAPTEGGSSEETGDGSTEDGQ